MPDDPEELERIHIPSLGTEAAFARIEDVCASIQRLINIVPTYLPLDGDLPQGPQLDGAGYKPLVNEYFKRINLPAGEWQALCMALPRSAATALKTLARTIDGLWRRWARAETDYGLFVEKARLARKRGDRLPDEVPAPLRSIQEQELTWLKQALAIVREAVDSNKKQKNDSNKSGEKRKVREKDESRDKWIYEKLSNIEIKQTVVLKEYKKVAAEQGWPPITTVNGLKDRARSYAERHDKEPLPKRQNR